MLKPVRTTLRGLLVAWSRLGRAPGWHYQVVEQWGARLNEPQGVPTTLVNGTRMRCDLADHVERQIYFVGLYEPIEAYLLTRLLRPGMTFVDGGANVGAHTLMASTAVGPAGAVLSFEPVPATAEKLEAHVTHNQLDNVRVNRAALWHESGTVQLGLPLDKLGNVGAYTIRGGDPASTVDAPAVRLDDYVQRCGIERVDLIKLDVEGAELFALQGMRQVLERHRPTLLVEICRTTCLRFGYEPQAIWELLNGEFGYLGWAIGESRAASHEIADLREVEQENVLFDRCDAPGVLSAPWDLKSVLRWARRRD